MSATTGVYRFLDLPGIGDTSPGDTVALSPNGRYVAYSVSTPPPVTGTPGPASIRFWDAETGQVTQVAIDSDRGSSQTGLSWSPDSNLLAFGVGRYTKPSGGGASWATVVVDVDGGEITLDKAGGPTDLTGWTADSHRAVWGRRLRSIDVTTGRDSALLRSPLPINVKSWASSPDGRLWVAGFDAKRVELVNVDTGGVRPLRVPPGTSFDKTSVFWINNDEVAVATTSGPDSRLQFGVWSVNIHSNGMSELVRSHAGADCDISSFATDLLTEPTRQATKPDWGKDPRVWFSWIVVAIFGLAVGLVLWTPIWPVAPRVRTSQDARLSGLDGDSPKD